MNRGRDIGFFGRARQICAWLWLLPVVMGCVAEETGFLNPDPDAKRTIVAEEGGHVTAKDGTSVVIPPRALLEDTEVATGAADEDKLPTLPFSRSLAATATSFTPFSLTFEQPVTVRLPYDPSLSENDLAVHKLEDLGDQDWERVPGSTFSNGFAEVETRSFGIYAITRGASQSQSGPGNVEIQFEYNTFAVRPEWVGYRDGDGPWTQLDTSSSTTSFQVTSGRYEVATYCGSGESYPRLFAATVDELNAVPVGCPHDRGRTIRASVNSTWTDEAANSFWLHQVREHTLFHPFTDDTFFHEGAIDIVAQERIATVGDVVRMQILRKFDVQALTTIDINLVTNGFDPIPRQVTIMSGGQPTTQRGNTYIRTSGGTTAWVGSNGTFGEPPASEIVRGDQIVVQHQQIVQQNDQYYSRGIFEPGSDLTMDVPSPYVGGSAALNPADDTEVETITWAARSEARLYMSRAAWEIVATPGFIGNGFSYSIPTMDGAPNWDPSWVREQSRGLSFGIGVVTGDVPSETNSSNSMLPVFVAEAHRFYSGAKGFLSTATLPSGLVMHSLSNSVSPTSN